MFCMDFPRGRDIISASLVTHRVQRFCGSFGPGRCGGSDSVCATSTASLRDTPTSIPGFRSCLDRNHFPLSGLFEKGCVEFFPFVPIGIPRSVPPRWVQGFNVCPAPGFCLILSYPRSLDIDDLWVRCRRSGSFFGLLFRSSPYRDQSKSTFTSDEELSLLLSHTLGVRFRYELDLVLGNVHAVNVKI